MSHTGRNINVIITDFFSHNLILQFIYMENSRLMAKNKWPKWNLIFTAHLKNRFMFSPTGGIISIRIQPSVSGRSRPT